MCSTWLLAEFWLGKYKGIYSLADLHVYYGRVFRGMMQRWKLDWIRLESEWMTTSCQDCHESPGHTYKSREFTGGPSRARPCIILLVIILFANLRWNASEILCTLKQYTFTHLRLCAVTETHYRHTSDHYCPNDIETCMYRSLPLQIDYREVHAIRIDTMKHVR